MKEKSWNELSKRSQKLITVLVDKFYFYGSPSTIDAQSSLEFAIYCAFGLDTTCREYQELVEQSK